MYCTARITPAGTQWEFNNGDAVSSVGDDEADAQDRRRNRALLKTMRMPGRTRQAHRAARYSCRSKSCLEESIYRPVSVKLLLSVRTVSVRNTGIREPVSPHYTQVELRC